MRLQSDPAIIAAAARSPQQAPPAPAPVEACPVRLSAGLTLEDALQAILDNCLQQIEANVAGVLAQDAESLHQMRVGLRRLRAALGLFKTRVQLPAALQRDLDWLAALLGKARDWDVLMAGTLELVTVDTSNWTRARQALLNGAASHAALAHQAVQRALRSRRYRHLAAALAGWIAGREWRQPQDGVWPGKLGRPVRKGMQPLLDQARRRLRKRLRHVHRINHGNHVGQADAANAANAADWHRARIAAKKARYAAEFFQSLLPARALKEELRRLKAMQDVLGSLNDLAIADTLLAQLQRQEAIGQAAAFARGYLAAVAAEKLSRAARISAA